MTWDIVAEAENSVRVAEVVAGGVVVVDRDVVAQGIVFAATEIIVFAVGILIAADELFGFSDSKNKQF